MKKWIIILIFILLAIVAYSFVYQDHRDISDEESVFRIQSNTIESEFSSNYNIAKSKYLNSTIEVAGKVSEYDENTIILDGKVFCQFIDKLDVSLTKDAKLKIKGRCIGYDDLLEQVKLDQCIIIKEKD